MSMLRPSSRRHHSPSPLAAREEGAGEPAVLTSTTSSPHFSASPRCRYHSRAPAPLWSGRPPPTPSRPLRVLNPLIPSSLYGRSRKGQALSTSPREEASSSSSRRSRLGAEMVAARWHRSKGGSLLISMSSLPPCSLSLSLSRSQGGLHVERGNGRPSLSVCQRRRPKGAIG
jgi:hypothetical protein